MRRHLPCPAMIVAIAALIVALGGSAYAAKVSLKNLSGSAKDKTAGVGPLTYASTTNQVGTTGAAGITVAAFCPGGTFPIGGGIRVLNEVNMFVNDSHPISGGWAGTVVNTGSPSTAVVSVACAGSREVDGTLQSTSRN